MTSHAKTKNGNSEVRYTGARTSEARFTSQVGAGSNRQCLAGVRDGICATSATLTGSKLENGVATCSDLISGGGALDVKARILSTFDVKNAAKSLAEKWLEP